MNLQTSIETLRHALRNTAALDDATRDALVALHHDIEEFLDRHARGSLAERLERLAVRFETDHPAVGAALRQAIDALAKAGI